MKLPLVISEDVLNPRTVYGDGAPPLTFSEHFSDKNAEHNIFVKKTLTIDINY